MPLTAKFGLISCFLAVLLSRMVGRKCAFCKKFLFIFDGVTCFGMMFFWLQVDSLSCTIPNALVLLLRGIGV